MLPDLSLLVMQNGGTRIAMPHVANIMDAIAIEQNADKLDVGQPIEVFVFETARRVIFDHWTVVWQNAV